MTRVIFRRIFDTGKNFIRMKSYQIAPDDVNLSVVLHKSNVIELEIRPIPSPKENELLIRVGYVCLSELDLHSLNMGPSDSQHGYTTPYVLGNQASGIVVSAGVGVEENFKEGDRVVLDPGVSCQNCEYCKQERYNLCPKLSYLGTENRSGALCRFVTHPMHYCYKLPQRVSLENGAFCTRLASAIHACKRGGLNKNSIVAIVGSSFIGVSLIIYCRVLGIKNVFIIEFDEYDLGMGRQFGAEYILKFHPHGDTKYLKEIIEEITGGQPDVSFDTGGTSKSLQTATDITKNGGQVIVVGPRPDMLKANLRHVTYREVDIKGVDIAGQSFKDAIQLLIGGFLPLKDFSPLIIPLQDSLEAFNNARVNIGGNAIVLIECYSEKK